MIETNQGGPAFPSHGTMGEVVQEGMTLRDYFAGQVLPVAYANGRNLHDIARGAYHMADAMLAAQSAPQPKGGA